MKMAKVIVGLSGGVDSAVAALLLKQQGYEVTGVTMAIWDGSYRSTGKHACYGADEEEEIREAREVAAKLEIPYHVFDCSARYKISVLEYFRKEYLAGRTPNPCIQCNKLIKFGLLPEMAKQGGLEFDFFATGHYSRVEFDSLTGRYLMRKGLDPRKDQSYFIYRLNQEQLSKALLPLGAYHKSQIMEIARNAGLMMHDYEESQDFYSGDYKEILNAEDVPGDITDSSGKVLGHHNGIWNYTIGQRKGLGIAHSEPLYVIALEQETNRVVVGIRQETFRTSFLVSDLSWIAFDRLEQPREAAARIRSAQQEKEALIEPVDEQTVQVTFFHPTDAVTPGQSAVFYDGDLVLGGGIIS